MATTLKDISAKTDKYLNDIKVIRIKEGKQTYTGAYSGDVDKATDPLTGFYPSGAAKDKMIEWGMIKNAPGLATETADGFISANLFTKLQELLSLKVVKNALVAKGEKGDSAYDLFVKYSEDKENLPTEEEWVKELIPEDILTSVNTGRSLSANQGRILCEMITAANTNISRLQSKINNIRTAINTLEADINQQLQQLQESYNNQINTQSTELTERINTLQDSLTWKE